ncbi:hypothetical protein [Brevibacillus dissolubilis]|uniref:hypothetical protein n=1 Tax=Brevibacillus dissolubilis TaxID=1844116 RepID=UPI0011168277|nr:hypothetical protein [Brevibacillus dissolubilis]
MKNRKGVISVRFGKRKDYGRGKNIWVLQRSETVCPWVAQRRSYVLSYSYAKLVFQKRLASCQPPSPLPTWDHLPVKIYTKDVAFSVK